MLPQIDDLFYQLKCVNIFLMNDLRSRYHQVKVVEGDIPKIVLRTKYGHYEFVVIPFGLIDAPKVFIDLINRVSQNCLDIFIMVFIDEIFMYFKT